MKINRRQYITYAFVIAAYIVLQILSGQKLLSSTARGMLVPICAYVVMAISLNLTVGVMGELSLGHAGFMSVGAFMGTTAAVSLRCVSPSQWSSARSSLPSSAFSSAFRCCVSAATISPS